MQQCYIQNGAPARWQLELTRSFHDLIGQLRQDRNPACQSHEYRRSKVTPCIGGGTWRKRQEEKGCKLERAGALARRRYGFISEIKTDVVDTGTIAVNITSETHVAAKAVFSRCYSLRP